MTHPTHSVATQTLAERPVILYIEDNTDNQRLVQRVLEIRGYQVLLAQDGPEGITLAHQSTPALILVDINIPGLDGYETTTRLRSMEHLRETPIVALTADTRSGTRERSLVAGCDGYIGKPIDTRMLPEQIQEFIEGRRDTVPKTVEAPMLREYTQKLVERLERQVREVMAANAELQEADRLKSQFLATFSHELRTPLTSILGYIALFERGTLGALTPVQREAIGVIARNANILASHLNNLLYLQEVRSSQLKTAPMHVHELLQRVLIEVRPQVVAAKLEVHAQIPAVAPFNGDAPVLELAFRNLIDNAIKFTPEGGTVQVVLTEEPTRLILQVTDTGIGIHPGVHEKIFLPFYQVDNSLTRPYSGVGIGLAIVKHIVEAHGGQVLVHSKLGAGSTFTVILPCT